jgi:hypothetical protein
MKSPHITMYCTCGGKIELTFKGDLSLDKQQSTASRIFRQKHSGDGHALCNRTTAAIAKFKSDRAKGRWVFGDDPWI